MWQRDQRIPLYGTNGHQPHLQGAETLASAQSSASSSQSTPVATSLEDEAVVTGVRKRVIEFANDGYGVSNVANTSKRARTDAHEDAGEDAGADASADANEDASEDASEDDGEDDGDDDLEVLLSQAVIDTNAGSEVKDLQFRCKSQQPVIGTKALIDATFKFKTPDSMPSRNLLNGTRYYLKKGPNAGKIVTVTAGTNLELDNENICRVTHIFEDLSGTPKMMARGFLLSPNKRLSPLLPAQPNEVFWHTERIDDGNSTALEYVDVDLSEVIGVRRVTFTNAPYPYLNKFKDACSAMSGPGILAKGAIICRWKYIKHFKQLNKHQVCGFELENTLVHDIDKLQASTKHFLKAAKLRDLCGQKNPLGGSGSGPESRPRYTMVDIFCGCGGSTLGALDAGIEVKLACDINTEAVSSYRKAFPKVKMKHMDVFDLITKVDATKYGPVDFLHISFPCQVYSMAHTRGEEAKDERNEAASYVIQDLIRKFKPRIVTLENPLGLLWKHFPQMCFILGQVTACHYSIRFSNLNCANYGVPQVRQRLIFVCSGPGTPIGKLPKPTHAEYPMNSRVLPWVTIDDTIGYVPIEARDHAMDFKKRPTRVANGKKPAKTITCAGGEKKGHPSGLRMFTAREIAMLQSFPLHHPFGTKLTDGKTIPLSKTDVIRQVGNAVPPLLQQRVMEANMELLWDRDYQEWLEEEGAAEEKESVVKEKEGFVEVIELD